MKIAVASDHAGYQYKEKIKSYLVSKHHLIEDFGTYSQESVDYPDYVHPACTSIEDHRNDRGILICGSGQGVAITANKHVGIRAALCWNTELARLSREHNNANVICFAERFLSYDLLEDMVDCFLKSEFVGGRHERRVKKIGNL